MTSLRIIYRAIVQWGENRDSRMGAALAYYTLFSIAPLLILAIHMASLFFGAHDAKGKVAEHLEQTFSREAAQAIMSQLETAAPLQTGTWPALIGLAVIVIGSLSIFLHVRGTLCFIWKLEPPHGNTWLGILLDYALAVSMVLITGLLLLASLVISTLLAYFVDTVEEMFPGGAFRWQLLEMAVSFLFLTLVFATAYRVLSGNRMAWGYVWYGSAICSLLFTAGKTLLGYYLAYTSTASMYGAAGSLVVFLIWVYYSSQILFFGAELIQARKTRHEWLGVPHEDRDRNPHIGDGRRS